MHKFKDKFSRLIGSNQQSPAVASQPSKELETHHAFGQFHTSTGVTPQSESTSTAPRDDPRSKRIRSMADRFRVLVIGRANAGKTTILQKVCNTEKRPEIFNTKGKKIKRSILKPSVGRGMHDIENELVFKSNPRFVFHDSRGFEAGGVDELDKVKKFISERSKLVNLSDQLHVIWYCIPMDDERPFTAAERSFFAECGTGSVPVVAIFTKFDALEDVAYGKLINDGIPHDDAINQTADRALADFERDYLPIFRELKYPPKGHVFLRDMNTPQADCRQLVETVAAVLDNTNLQRLFVSTQRNNLELCIKFAMERELIPELRKTEHGKQPIAGIPTQLQKNMARWFPHFWRERRFDRGDFEFFRRFFFEFRVVLELLMGPDDIGQLNAQSDMLSFINFSPKIQDIARFGIAFVIILEHSFYLWDQAPSSSIKYLISAFNVYQSSGKHMAVAEAVDEIFKGEDSHLLGEAKDREDPATPAFAERLTQIALENRLSPS